MSSFSQLCGKADKNKALKVELKENNELLALSRNKIHQWQMVRMDYQRGQLPYVSLSTINYRAKISFAHSHATAAVGPYWKIGDLVYDSGHV